MKRLEIFLSKMRASGFYIQTTWQQTAKRGYLEHVTIRKYGNWTTAIFHVYPGDAGFDMYVMPFPNDFDGMIAEVERLLTPGLNKPA